MHQIAICSRLVIHMLLIGYVYASVTNKDTTTATEASVEYSNSAITNTTTESSNDMPTTASQIALTSETMTPTMPSVHIDRLPNDALKLPPAHHHHHEAMAITATHRTYLGMQKNITQSAGSLDTPSGSSSPPKIRTESKQILPKPHKTDAPMLNYIFDSFSAANRHHHHDHRYGPHFEDLPSEGNVTNITVQAGGNVYLNCRISLLQDKTVSWVKRNPVGEEGLELLTVGMHTYSGDSRYTMEFQYPNNWRLKISNARKSDEGSYECQISTHPPRVIQINLHVNAPKVMIVDEHGAPLQEKYYEIDSTLQLSCIVRNVVMSSSVVYWNHGDQILNYDTTRGGVSVKTELMEIGANSTLFIAKINKSDSGNYTCSINASHEYSIMVHILNGESFAELHDGNSSRIVDDATSKICLLLVALLFHSVMLNFVR